MKNTSPNERSQEKQCDICRKYLYRGKRWRQPRSAFVIPVVGRMKYLSARRDTSWIERRKEKEKKQEETRYPAEDMRILSSTFDHCYTATRRRIDEMKRCNVGPSRFVPFRIPNHVQSHQNPEGKRVLFNDSFSSTRASSLSPVFSTTL